MPSASAGHQKIKKARGAKRPGPDLHFETTGGYPARFVAGVDEVGRGCLAGPVVAAAIILPAEIDWERDCWLLDVTDSKCLSEPAREELSPLILGWARAVGVGSAGVDEIDRLNIYHASHLAMVRAVEELGQTIWPEHLLVDGNVVPKKLREGFSFSTAAVVKGDLKCLSIAAASIVAKVYRDGLMKKWDEEFPVYGFSSHKGYGTPAHLAALGTHGVCPLHRRSFAPVAAVVSSLV